MDLKKLLSITTLVLFSQVGFSHDSECLNFDSQKFSRPCIERLIPRSLDLDKTMLEPRAILYSVETETTMPINGKPLVAVLGATGRTGRHVLTELSNREVRIRALSRNIETAKESVSGNYNWVKADVTQPDTLINALHNVDILISVIGAEERRGEKSPESVSYQGSINFVKAAKKTGVKHIIYMSSIGAGGAENFSTVLLNLVLGKTMKWKSLGEEYIRNSGIKYTIVRPGGLVGDSGQLGIKFAQGDKIIGFIPRADVASVLVESAFNEHSYDKTFEVINDESLVVDAWRNEFVNLNKEEFGQIATGNFPLSYTFSILLILVLIIYFIRRRKSR